MQQPISCRDALHQNVRFIALSSLAASVHGIFFVHRELSVSPDAFQQPLTSYIVYSMI
jgi:ABC-type branched-subunit amino acid transport system permease subunit